MAPVSFGAQYMVVNITFLLTVIRYISVRFPMNMCRFFKLSKLRLRGALVIIVAYCAVFNIAVTIVRLLETNSRAHVIVSITAAMLLLFLPLVLQLLLTIKLVVYFKAEGRKLNELSPDHPLAQTRLILNRRLNITVISMCAMAFIAYPVTVAVISYVKLSPHSHISEVKKVVLAGSAVLHVINSSISFVFYYVFSPRFRKRVLIKLRMQEPEDSKETLTKPGTGTTRRTTYILPDQYYSKCSSELTLHKKLSREFNPDEMQVPQVTIQQYPDTAQLGRNVTELHHGMIQLHQAMEQIHEDMEQSDQGTTQPYQGTTQPGQGTTQPGQGTTQPSQGTTQPGQGTTQPSQGTTQPDQGTTQPGQGTKQPDQGTKQSN
ncbi:hypothetical protein ACOMHN_006897 [Nucella lapillus]